MFTFAERQNVWIKNDIFFLSNDHCPGTKLSLHEMLTLQRWRDVNNKTIATLTRLRMFRNSNKYLYVQSLNCTPYVDLLYEYTENLCIIYVNKSMYIPSRNIVSYRNCLFFWPRKLNILLFVIVYNHCWSYNFLMFLIIRLSRKFLYANEERLIPNTRLQYSVQIFNNYIIM